MARTGSRVTILWLTALALYPSAGCGTQGDGTVTLQPGQDIQAVVASSPEGTRFYFEPGIYRQQTVYPKDGQEFIGQDGVILSGAMELKRWKKQAEFWTTEGLPPSLPVKGSCREDRELCALREDLFFNGHVYERVGSLDDVGSGTWYYEDGRAYLAVDPTGQSVELGVTPLAFGGDAEAVVLRDLVVEKYASQAQQGAIDLRDGRNWLVVDVTARWNHGVGIYVGDGTHVEGGAYSHNGQLGMGGVGDGVTIEGVEIAFNNYAGFRAGWEAGGTKFSRIKGLVVRNSCVHHNNGPGLWTDIDNIDIIYEGNKVFMNENDGIKHEISYDAVIRNNISADNGKEHHTWLWGSQILVQNSQNVEVYDNVVEVPAEFGNGISVVHQDRGQPGQGEHGPWDALNNQIHHNTIIHLGNRGQNGVARDADEDWFWQKAGNSFDWNTYIAPDKTAEYWEFHDRSRDWNELRELGYEANGAFVAEQRAPTALSCDS